MIRWGLTCIGLIVVDYCVADVRGSTIGRSFNKMSDANNSLDNRRLTFTVPQQGLGTVQQHIAGQSGLNNTPITYTDSQTVHGQMNYYDEKTRPNQIMGAALHQSYQMTPPVVSPPTRHERTATAVHHFDQQDPSFKSCEGGSTDVLVQTDISLNTSAVSVGIRRRQSTTKRLKPSEESAGIKPTSELFKKLTAEKNESQNSNGGGCTDVLPATNGSQNTSLRGVDKHSTATQSRQRNSEGDVKFSSEAEMLTHKAGLMKPLADDDFPKNCDVFFPENHDPPVSSPVMTAKLPVESNEVSNGESSRSSSRKEGHLACQYCGKTFKFLSKLKTHENTHTKNKPFACICGKKFAQKSNLRTHERIHNNEKRFLCDTCGQRFAQLSHLTSHQRTHTGDKPFACNICGKRFAEMGNLRTHERIHNNEKRFVCDTCGQRFAQLSHLTIHQRIHTGDKPFACNICGKRFAQMSNLRTHERRHNNAMDMKGPKDD